MILGLPNLLGFMAATVFGSFLNWLMPPTRRPQVLFAVDLFSGFATVFAGILVLKLVGFKPEMWLPISSAIWFAIHFWLIDGFRQFLLSVGGVMGAWVVYLCY